MEIREYLQTLWKWWWLILLCTLIAGVASWVVTSTMSPVYEAKVKLMSNQLTDTGIVDYSSLLGGQQVIESYRELLKTRPVLETVITRLNLPYSSKRLAEHIDVSVIQDTRLLELKVTDNNPQRAADIANEIALTFLLQLSSEQQFQEVERYEQILAEQIRELEQAIDKTETEIEQLRASPGLLTQEELRELQQSQVQQRGTLANLLSGYFNIRSMKSRLLDIVIVESAEPPTVPVAPRKLFTTAIAAFSGCAIACVVAFLLEYLRNTFETTEEMRDTLALPSLGAIPFVKAWGRDHHAAIKDAEWPSAEAFRILRTNVHFASIESAIHTLLVTSPGPGDGKTNVIARLGIAMAQNGRKTLLVDADLRCSHLHQIFGVPNSTGLTLLLLNEAELEHCVVDVDTPNLYVLPSGPLPPNPSELLGSQPMARLIEEFQSFADVVLFDVPPVLAYADAMVLAARMDGVVLVVDSRATRQEAALRAVEVLHNADARILGAVLNKV
ncbi:MAG: polysaccharide biosynthesis tyrosine autokinase, partial [Anaerolineae bacterium]|nr:polysaccharide biosynthesis tyrosine autokinase [Anaerolineae bacterium]